LTRVLNSAGQQIGRGFSPLLANSLKVQSPEITTENEYSEPELRPMSRSDQQKR
jgi:hypothetical protein